MTDLTDCYTTNHHWSTANSRNFAVSITSSRQRRVGRDMPGHSPVKWKPRCALGTRGLSSATDAYDSNYFVVSFDTATCPDQLKLVTHVSAICASFFVHHHREFQRVPCFTCYSPLFKRKVRVSSRCSPPGPSQKSNGTIPRIQPFSWIDLCPPQ